MGDPFICGDYGGKVKSLDRRSGQTDEGSRALHAGKGARDSPVCRNAGDELLVMQSERAAKT